MAISSGAVLSHGLMKTSDFVEPYLRMTLNFLGIIDVTIFRVAGLGVTVVRDTALQKALKSVDEFQLS